MVAASVFNVHPLASWTGNICARRLIAIRQPARPLRPACAAARAAVPANPPPACRCQHRFRSHRKSVGDRMLARTAMTGDEKDQSDIIAINLLMLENTYRPGEATSTQPLSKRSRQTVACVSQNYAEPDTCHNQPIDLGKSNLRLRARYP